MTKKPTWEIVPESLDFNNNPSIWSLDIRGTETEERFHTPFIWISMIKRDVFRIEINSCSGNGYITKMYCKTLRSAKRWVTMNLL